MVLRFCLIPMALHSVLTKFPVNLGSVRYDVFGDAIPWEEMLEV